MDKSVVRCLYEVYLEKRIKDKNKKKRSDPSKDYNLQKKILIVEDQVSDILPVKAILEDMGYVIDIGFDGRGAVENLVKQDYDLVILDWLMPDFCGGEALEFAQKMIDEGGQESSITIPFIAYSGLKTEKLDVPETKNFQMIDHWQKPMNVVELTKKIHEYFSEAA